MMNPSSSSSSSNKLPSFSILQPKSGPDKAAIKRVTEWVAKHIDSIDSIDSSSTSTSSSSSISSLKNSYTIMVTQVQCFDPNCVPLETVVILVGDGDKFSEKIQKPIVEVAEADVECLSIIGKIRQKYFSMQTIAIFSDKLDRIRNSSDKLEYIRSVAAIVTNAERTLLESMEVDDDDDDNDDVVDYDYDDNAAALDANNSNNSSVVADVSINSNSINSISGDNNIIKNKSETEKLEVSQPSSTFVPMVRKENVVPVHVAVNGSIGREPETSFNSSNSSSNNSNSSNSSSSSSNNNISSSSSSSLNSSNLLDMPKSVSLGAPPDSSKQNSSSNALPVYSAKPSAFKSMQAVMKAELGVGSRGGSGKKAHEKKSGCPCCDPDNVDTIIDKMMFFEA